MPEIFESEEYIYNAIINETYGKTGPIFKFNPLTKLYEYSNPLYPNKTYKKTFDPSFMKRGDVIHCGNNHYRNNNKLIFNGEKLEDLYTIIDDYGSVPPDYVVGDNPEDFNIGDFEALIEHNQINWLSKETLSKIELFEKNEEIIGKVMIKNKLWFIQFTYYTSYEHDLESLQTYINKLVTNYDDLKNRHPFNRNGNNLLEMIFFD